MRGRGGSIGFTGTVDLADLILGGLPNQWSENGTSGGIPPTFVEPCVRGSKLTAILSGAAPATRKRYLSACGIWAYFAHMRGKSERLIKTQPNWDGALIDFMLFEPDVMKNT